MSPWRRHRSNREPEPTRPHPPDVPAGAPNKRFGSLLSDEVRPFLKAHGFAKSGATFVRLRRPLFDVVAFHGNKWNGLGRDRHGFFVNVGVGSDDVHGPVAGKRPTVHDCVVKGRWEDFAEHAPPEVEIFLDTDDEALAGQVRRHLTTVLARMDAIDATDALVDLAVATNWLHRMEWTCAYLAGIGDGGRLSSYVGALRGRFGEEGRWEILNRRLSAAVGPTYANVLREQGLLDDPRRP